MFRRCLMLSSVPSLTYYMYPRRCCAESRTVKCESYRERFEVLNNEDRNLVLEKYKDEIAKAYGHSNIVSTLPSDVIDELHYILILYSKPLSPERRIMLRKKILPYMEKSDAKTQQFYENILEYYDLLN